MLSNPGRARWLSKLERVVSARVVEKVERRAAQSAPQWCDRLQCARWAVPLVDMVLAALPPASATRRYQETYAWRGGKPDFQVRRWSTLPRSPRSIEQTSEAGWAA